MRKRGNENQLMDKTLSTESTLTQTCSIPKEPIGLEIFHTPKRNLTNLNNGDEVTYFIGTLQNIDSKTVELPPSLAMVTSQERLIMNV